MNFKHHNLIINCLDECFKHLEFIYNIMKNWYKVIDVWSGKSGTSTKCTTIKLKQLDVIKNTLNKTFQHLQMQYNIFYIEVLIFVFVTEKVAGSLMLLHNSSCNLR